MIGTVKEIRVKYEYESKDGNIIKWRKLVGMEAEKWADEVQSRIDAYNLSPMPTFAWGDWTEGQ